LAGAAGAQQLLVALVEMEWVLTEQFIRVALTLEAVVAGVLALLVMEIQMAQGVLVVAGLVLAQVALAAQEYFIFFTREN
jgi:hypothetical protein